MFYNFIGSTKIPVEFMQSDPNSLDLPPPRAHILKVITCWGVAKVEFTRLQLEYGRLKVNMEYHTYAHPLRLWRCKKRDRASVAVSPTTA